MSLEKNLITSVIKNRASSKLLRSGLTIADFTDLKPIAEFVFSYAEYGDVTEELLATEFPNFEYSSPVLEFEYVVDKFFKNILAREAQRIVNTKYKDIIEYAEETGVKLLQLKNRVMGKTVEYNEFGNRIVAHDERLYSECYNMGIPLIDTAIGGLYKSQSFALIAPMKSGKTWFLCKLTKNFRRQGANVLVITKEMTGERLRDRMDSLELGMNFQKIRKGQLDDREKERWKPQLEAVTTEDFGSLTIIEDYGKSIQGIVSYIRQYRPDVLLIDGAYLWAKSSLWSDAGEVTREISSYCRKYGILIGYTWQANAPELKTIGASSIGLSKNALLADVDFALGINVNPELRQRGLMELNLMTTRDSDTAKGYIGWSFTDKGYPEITEIAEDFHLEDLPGNSDVFDNL